MRAMSFTKHSILYFIIAIIVTGAGLWIHSDFRVVSLIGLLAGIVIGWRISK